jgi:hypothetical protein
MTRITFAQLPLVVRIMTVASMFMAWVLFAELVLDRYGFDKFLPFYRLADLGVYDVAVALAICVFWVMAHRRRG